MLKRWIIPKLAAYPHDIYVEPYGGGASVLFAKPPAPVEVYNDLNGDLVEFFKILADPAQFKKFVRLVALLPHSRKMFYDYRAEYVKEKNPIVRAAKWFYVIRKSFSGTCGRAWGHAITMSTRGMATMCSSWLGVVEKLPEVHARFQRVQIEHLPALRIIKKYDTPNTLFYLDPPYIAGTRSVAQFYRHEMTDEDHAELLETILNIKGKACLSGYEHPIYQPLLDAGWTMATKSVTCVGANCTNGNKPRKPKRIECLYMSPA